MEPYAIARSERAVKRQATVSTSLTTWRTITSTGLDAAQKSTSSIIFEVSTIVITPSSSSATTTSAASSPVVLQTPSSANSIAGTTDPLSTTINPSSTTTSATSPSSTPGTNFTTFGNSTSPGNSTTPPSSANTASAKGSNVSSGAVAGISIATFLIGLGLGVLALRFLMSRRKRERQGRMPDQVGSAGVGAGSVGEKQNDHALLDPADDSALRSTMSKLNSFIDQHVLSNYHEDKVAISVAQVSKTIADCSLRVPSGGTSLNDLASLLIAPSSRLQAIRYFIAWAILSNTRLDARPEACLLPQFIVAFYNAFPPAERMAGSDEAFETAMTAWKHTSAFLLVPNRSYREEPKLNAATVQTAIDQNLKLLLHVLDPFISGEVGQTGEWEKNLRAIILSGAELALCLFSQQSNWVFDWDLPAKAGGEGSMVFPALFEKPRGRSRPRLVFDGVVI